MATDFSVYVDTLGGVRKHYFFDTKEDADAFILTCKDRVVSGPNKTIHLSEEEDD
jgi:hypothetical protein